TGAKPFSGEYDPAVLYAILETEPGPIDTYRHDAPEGLSTVLARALAKDPAGRYQSAGELIADLQPLAGSMAPSAPPSARGPTLRRVGWPLYAGGAAVLGALAIALILLTTQSPRTPAIRSLAVLPFRSTSAKLDDTVFAEGMTEALSTELSRIRALAVRSSRSAMRFRDSDKPLTEIARELNVDALVDGSTQLSGTSVRVSVSLINVSPERQIWGENYTEQIEDINALQGNVAAAIAREISVVLTPEEQARLHGGKPVNVEAYEQCVYGRYYWNKWTAAGFQKSLASFRAAAATDPSYAPAYAGIADVYATLWYMGMVPFDSVEPFWRSAAQKALALDPAMAEGHVSLASTRLVYDWDWAGAEQELQRAFLLNPGYATGHHWYALLLSAAGRHDSAISEIHRALELDPLSVIILASAGWIHIHARSFDEAIAHFRKAIDLDSLCAPAHSGLGEIFEMQGMDREALAEYLRVARVTGGSFATLGGAAADPASRLESAYRAAGWRGYWEEQLTQLEEQSHRRYVSAFHIASVLARLKRTDEAFRWLEKAYGERSTNFLFLNVDPNLTSLREDARFGALARRIGLTPLPRTAAK
ncbi:MAG TPA: hypothetical protein VMM80_11675, partial [Bacteroidota bacterium]|nr:hypothetical protein [Bacteroidota bacterium]